MLDYAKAENRNLWLRHPTLGDPSFDTFEKVGETVHKSQPPYEWGVNGSLFKDPKTGYWYYYAGIYPFGYNMYSTENPPKFIIYKSKDKGASWECLGDGFERGFSYEGHTAPSDIFPDVVVIYDEDTDLYWLTYDWIANDICLQVPDNKKNQYTRDSGAAIAYSSSPEGPFTRLKIPFFSNYEQFGKLGRFSRGYASSLIKRKNDWIAYILCDSGAYFSWGLACMTAKTPFGKWSEPKLLLSVDRNEYYPAPVEFHPVFEYKGKVYAPATSVSLNRNYQAVFSADLENAHLPEAWKLEFDGGFWHSRDISDEKYGIWGQTINGFVDEESGDFTVMYPSKDERNFGTLSVASRKWEQPFSDGFTFSGHAGKSISILLNSYKDFSLDADIKFTGTVEIAFDYDGILGLNTHSSDATLHRQTLTSYYSVTLDESGNCKFIKKDKLGNETVIESAKTESPAENIRIENVRGNIRIFINKKCLIEQQTEISSARPIAIIAHEFSILNCSSFKVSGEMFECRYKLNSYDAIMGGGQVLSDWEKYTDSECISEDVYISDKNVFAKWNFIGKGFQIYSPKGKKFGAVEIWVDGYFYSTINLYSDESRNSDVIYSIRDLKNGRHCVVLRPKSGCIAVDTIEITA